LTTLEVWNDVADRMVRADSVRSALAFVDRGEALLGIVYETDALIDKHVRVGGRVSRQQPLAHYLSRGFNQRGQAHAARLSRTSAAPQAKSHSKPMASGPCSRPSAEFARLSDPS